MLANYDIAFAHKEYYNKHSVKHGFILWNEVILEKQGTQAIHRVFAVLEELATEKSGIGVTALSLRLELHKSTVHRLLNALVSLGYVEKSHGTSKYQLGLKLIELTSLHINKLELKTEAAPLLRELLKITGQPIHLATMMQKDAVYIDKVESINSLRMYSQIGRRLPLHCTAVGKCLLSGLSVEELDIFIDTLELKKYTSNTLINKADLIAELQIVKIRGWAIDDEEFERGIRCIGAPLFDYRGKVMAAISTSGPFGDVSIKKDGEFAKDVVDIAQKISYRMGYTPLLKM